jgi:pSer/pThr/pTyr-binding forkhead associated (FHA) protein
VRTVHRFGYRFVAGVDERVGTHAGAERGHDMYLTTADRQFRLAGGAIVIGRAADAAIRLESGGVSRHHARIVIAGDEARVEDLGSKNGTFVDGQPVIGTLLLTDGAEIRIGPVTLTFRVAPPADATQTMS